MQGALRLSTWTVLLLAVSAFLFVLVAAAPMAMAEPSKGELELGPRLSNGDGILIDDMEIRYEFSQFFQEPMERYSFKYETSDKTSRVLTIKVRAQVWIGSQAQDAYVIIDPQTGMPGEWSWDMAGSPDWGKTFTRNNGKFVPANVTQGYFSEGFTLKVIDIIDISVDTATDEEYESRMSGMGSSEAVPTGEDSSLEAGLPRNSAGGSGAPSDDSFWDERRVYSSPSTGQLDQENGGGGLKIGSYADTVEWTYVDYVHEVASIRVYGFVEQKEGVESKTPVAAVTVRWSDHHGKTVATSRYSHEVTGDERIVIAERQKKLSDGSFPTASYSVRFKLQEKKKKREEDPVLKKGRRKELDAMLADAEQAQARENATYMKDTREIHYDSANKNAEKDAEYDREFPRRIAEALEITTPYDGHSSDRNVVYVEGRVDRSFFSSNSGSYYLSTNGQTQSFAVDSDGRFRSAVVLGAGANEVKLVGESQGATGYVSITINYTGPRSRLRATLTWDNGSSDMDLHVRDPADYHVSYGEKSSGGMSLDVDNTKGYGPENVSVPSAREGNYRISVVNFSNSSGVTATVHVFVDEQLENTYSHTFYSGDREWDVTSVYMR